MGTFTNTLRHRYDATLVGLPPSIGALIRLGADRDFRGLAIPDMVSGSIASFDLWLCQFEISHPTPTAAAHYRFIPQERAASVLGVWTLRRWQQRITAMTTNQRVEGMKPMFGIWRLDKSYGDEPPTFVKVEPDHRLISVVWPSGTQWCTVSPINPAVRRAGL